MDGAGEEGGVWPRQSGPQRWGRGGGMRGGGRGGRGGGAYTAASADAWRVAQWGGGDRATSPRGGGVGEEAPRRHRRGEQPPPPPPLATPHRRGYPEGGVAKWAGGGERSGEGGGRRGVPPGWSPAEVARCSRPSRHRRHCRRRHHPPPATTAHPPAGRGSVWPTGRPAGHSGRRPVTRMAPLTLSPPSLDDDQRCDIR